MISFSFPQLPANYGFFSAQQPEAEAGAINLFDQNSNNLERLFDCEINICRGLRSDDACAIN